MEKPDHPLQTLATDAVRMMTAGQTAALAVFEAEVRAIGALLEALPGTDAAEDAAGAEARLRAADEAAERAFDNMPV